MRGSPQPMGAAEHRQIQSRTDNNFFMGFLVMVVSMMFQGVCGYDVIVL